jgi:hypothetical protein
MTPAEFRELAKQRIEWYEQDRKDRRDEKDIFNAYLCLVIQRSMGNDKATLEDFMIFRPHKPASKVQSEKDWNNALGAWTA